MKTSEYKKFMKNMVSHVKKDMNSIMFSFASKSSQQLISEAIESGINFDGNDGQRVTYSSKKIPAWIRKKYILNAAGEFSVKFVPMQSWGDFRLVQGLKSRYVNLKYTGEFWDSFTVISSQTKIYVVYFGDKDVMSNLEEKFGEFHAIPDRILKSFQDSLLRVKFTESIVKRL